MMFDLTEFHEQLLDILLEFDRICKKNNIKYSLAYGTLIGALRHKGFIPWDDDVDVMMDRKNFEKFRSIVNKDLSNDYFFQSKETEPLYPYNLCRLRKNNTAMIYKEWENSGINLGIYMDIYPMDHIPDNEILRKIQSFFIIFNTPIRMTRNPVIYKNGATKLSKSAYIVKNGLYKILKLFPRRQCEKIEYDFITKYDNKSCKYSNLVCEGGLLLKPDLTCRPFPSKYLDTYTTTEFEGHELMIIKEADALLRLWYGDYMKLPPVEERTMYHHPDIYSTKKSYKEFI